MIPHTIVGLVQAVERAVDRLARLGRIKLATIVALATGNLCAVLQPGLSVGAVLTQAAVAGFACYLPLLLCAVASTVVQTLAGRRPDAPPHARGAGLNRSPGRSAAEPAVR